MFQLDYTTWLERLQELNTSVNHDTTYVADKVNIDSWDLPIDGVGDCEDYALFKAAKLGEIGVPKECMYVAYCTHENIGHLVLGVITDQGDVILDNRSDIILFWDQLIGHYQFKAKSQAGKPITAPWELVV